MADQPAEIIGKPVQLMDDSERHGSFSEAVIARPVQETAGQKRIRDLAAKANSGTLTNSEIQESLKILLGVKAAEISRIRKPKP